MGKSYGNFDFFNFWLPLLIIVLCVSSAGKTFDFDKNKRFDNYLQYRNAGSGKDYEHDETEDFAQDYMRYYQETYDDAMMGDESAVMEMQDEFGDDWKGEF